MTQGARLLLLTLVSGCATTSPIRTATMEADPTLIGAEGIALQNQLSLAYTRVRPPTRNTEAEAHDICHYIQPSYQERGSPAYSRHEAMAGRRGGRTAAEQFECLYLIDNPTQDEVRRHLRAGMALSDLYCDTYFRRISRHWNERMFARNATNDVGAAISAVLGLASAGSGVTGAVGAAFGLVDATFRNYDNVFVVSPDLPALQNLVREKQQELRTTIEGNPPDDFYRAEIRIIEYARLCSYTGMRGLLNLAVDQTINNLRGPEGIRRATIEAATQAGRQRRLIAEAEADNAEAEAAARQRARTARQQAAAPPDETPPADSTAPPPGETTPNDGSEPPRRAG